jgi:regulator of sigma E protease
MENVIYAIVSAVIGLGILIVVHEFGHFIVAKKSGVGVLTFSVGFGPKLWKRKIGETEYAVSAFPLGGYVKMVGEEPGEEVKEVDIKKSFSHQALGKRAAIVAAGPIFNLLLAVVTFAFLFMLFGIPILTTRVDHVTPGLPAAQAGVQKGDRIVAVDGQPIRNWEELANRIRGSQGQPLNLQIKRDDRLMEVTVQPVRKEGKNVFGERQETWLIGVTSSEASIERIGPWRAVGHAFYKTGELSVLTLVALFKMIKGDVSPKNIGGPLMIAQMAGQQAQEGSRSFFSFIAVLSINLGVLNLLPIPVLDGGHLIFFLVECVLGRPVELKHRERAQQIGVFILILVMIYAFYNDLSRFFEG